jgi:hypothetical protein
MLVLNAQQEVGAMLVL